MTYYLWMNPGQHASGVFLFSFSSELCAPSAPTVPCSTPSSNVRLLLWPERYKYENCYKASHKFKRFNKLSNRTLQFDKISYKLVSHNKEETEEGLKMMYLQILSANSCSDIQWLVADKMFSFTLIDDLSDWLVRIWPPSSSCRSGSGNSSSRELSSIVCLQKRMCEWVRSGIYF